MSAHPITAALLRRMPLPRPDAEGDKDARGRVLVIGGSTLVPGAVLLAGVAALRAGAGKLQLATAAAASIPLGLAVPEALVIGLPTSRRGEMTGAGAKRLREYAADADAVLLGPGMSDARAARALSRALLKWLKPDATLVLDAAGLFALIHDAELLAPLAGRAILTPHAGEMATLLGIDKADVEAEPSSVATLAAQQFGATIVLKGSESWIAEPDGSLLRYAGGSVGLATSGSGDTLAGVIAGLSARGADQRTAAAWGVWAHGSAGARLAGRTGRVGFLARELLAEIPKLVGG